VNAPGVFLIDSSFSGDAISSILPLATLLANLVAVSTEVCASR